MVEPAASDDEERRRKKNLKNRLLPPSVAEVVESENRAVKKQAAGGVALMLGVSQPRCAVRGCRAPHWKPRRDLRELRAARRGARARGPRTRGGGGRAYERGCL